MVTEDEIMTPQERQRVIDLFNRLAQLENNPRERDAEQLIAEGLRHAPHATYAMVQTILIQEEALTRANERIAELEAGGEEAPVQQSGGFLDTLRGAFGGNAGQTQRVSVPSTRQPGAPMGVPPGFRRGSAPGAEQQQPIGRGGSFLGQAASVAAGVVVGSMVVDALRGQFGSEAGTTGAQEASTQPEAQTEQARAEQDQAGYEDAGYDTAGYDDGGGFDAGGDFG
jgi:hypothetical protein